MSSIESAPIITFTRIPAKVGMDYGGATIRGARAKKGKEMRRSAVGFHAARLRHDILPSGLKCACVFILNLKRSRHV
jgi:hypothetical protein